MLARRRQRDAVSSKRRRTAYAGPFEEARLLGRHPARTLYQQTQGLTINCPAASCTNDVLGSTLTFNAINSVVITATSANGVWGDFNPNFGGLGVGVAADGSDSDEIAGNEVLHLAFTSAITSLPVAVTLTGVATLFDPGHTPFGSNFLDASDVQGTNDFLLSLNGVFSAANKVTFGAANNTNGGPNDLSFSGTDFYFKQDTSGYQPEFYVSGLVYDVNTPGGQCTGGTCPVPGPIVGAGLPGLIFAAGGLLGWRKRKAALA